MAGSSEDGSDGSDSGSYSSGSEEAPLAPLLRPKFVPKSQRAKADADPISAAVDDGPTVVNEMPLRQAPDAAIQRQAAVDAMLEEQLQRDMESRAAGKKEWDHSSASGESVDTTDDLDPEAEEAAWRLRELKRIKRAREGIEAREREIAELERRSALTEQERMAEDADHLERQREARESRGRMSYLQKYYHSGAYYRDDTDAAGLLSRDIMGSHIADDVRDRAALPEYLQRRDMTRLGRKGATKYKDLQSEDTGRWGETDQRGPPTRGFVDDSRFRPDFGQEGGARGANATPLGDDRRRQTALDGDGGAARPAPDRAVFSQRERGAASPHRRGPKSPPQSNTHRDTDRRKRSTSPETRLPEGDKRRRVHVAK